jgi:hypothetical protein
MKWWLGTISCTIFFASIALFAYMKMNFILHGVAISAAIDPGNNSSMVTIKGTAKNAIHLTLNGREIYISPAGEFTEPVALLPGLGVVTLSAKDKFGNTSRKEFEVVYKDNSQVAMIPVQKN